jgi:PII-like signaling protein
VTGNFLKLYVPQTAKHDGKMLSEWLLEEARSLGIPGGSAFRAVAGYGRHGRLHEEHFFELAGDLPMTVEFFAEEAAIAMLLARLQEQKISLFYVRFNAEAGITAFD